MKKIIYLFAFAALFVACEKEEMSTPLLSVEDPLAEVIRIAQEGAAMLDDAQTRSVVARRIDRSSISCKINPATRAGEADDTLYYVVNYADNAGFAIVSADENASDGARLIAVTESGSYTAGEKTENEGFNMYVDMLSAYFGEPSNKDSLLLIQPSPEYMGDSITEYTSYEYSEWESVGPLVSVKWGQGTPYNTYCFTPNNIQAPAGCVATAIAQIMTAHKFPQQLALTYDPHNGQSLTLNWNLMQTHVSSSSCSSMICNHDMIAKMFRQIGDLSQMEYDEHISTALPADVATAFRALGYQCSDIQSYAWTLVRDNLDIALPVFMGGFYNNNGYIMGGHAWVVDGYKLRFRYLVHHDLLYNINTILDEVEYHYLHINWGWDGQSNGYFRDDVLDPKAPYNLDEGEMIANQNNYNYWPQIVKDIYINTAN